MAFFEFADFLKCLKKTIYYDIDKKEFQEAAIILGSKTSAFVDLNHEFSNLQVFNGL